MHAYSFRLEGVQRVRGLEVARARQRVATLARALATAKSRELDLLASCASTAAPLGHTSGDEFIANQEHESRLAASLADAIDERRVIESQLARARSEALQAEADEAVLAHLDERRRSEWVELCRREDALELDEFANLRAAARAIEASHDD